ncbi:hypothetical protein SNOG_00838 [Parastagonospora nodorum SN15]|uniref:Uncharacterized protein n=1 Tax=Phaeosphaeria nodorum (strain SN15 / ATCC MYA-4574 / FGSC 10173) TaxID=321614 RepID=Q0V576_PHANO|nr:hypothetical protein SNOG_00838 [Parastagonospora nodorum SN15]EAT92333.1 hypothetical protein SNOG_00838 [Parastagonospora nodorum SN15]
MNVMVVSLLHTRRAAARPNHTPFDPRATTSQLKSCRISLSQSSVFPHFTSMTFWFRFQFFRTRPMT